MRDKGAIPPRYRAVLESIISQYIGTAVPVGSRTVSQTTDLKLSPATIRNIMADLEEMGYLMQPHTSAGRVPTDKGYRYYVDVLMEVQRITREEEERIRNEYEKKQKEISEVLQRTTRLLSVLTRKPSMMAGPKKTDICLRHLELVRLRENRLLAVLVTQSGVVENVYVDMGRVPEPAVLEQLQNFINRNGRGKNLMALAGELKELASREMPEPARRECIGVLLDELLAAVQEDETTVYVDGTSLLLEGPDFRDLSCVKDMLRTLENREQLKKILRKGLDAGEKKRTMVKIGNENQVIDLRDCSVVTSRYRIGNQPMGTLGIVGPTRLEYPKVIAVIDLVATIVSEVLTEYRYD